KRRAAARGEGRAASPGRAEREPPGGPSAGRVDLPWRGGVLRLVVIDRCDCGDEPARVRGDREAGEPREGDVLVQVVEWGSHSPCLPRALSPGAGGGPCGGPVSSAALRAGPGRPRARPRGRVARASRCRP